MPSNNEEVFYEDDTQSLEVMKVYSLFENINQHNTSFFIQISENLNEIAAMGKIIGEEHENASESVKLSMKALSLKVQKLLNHIRETIAELGLFEEFTDGLIQLNKSSQDVLKSSTVENIIQFGDTVNQTNPMRVANNLLLRYEQQQSNEEKERDIVDKTLAFLMFVETMADGIFWQADQSRLDQLKRKIQGINEKYQEINQSRLNTQRESSSNDGEYHPLIPLESSSSDSLVQLQTSTNLNMSDNNENSTFEDLSVEESQETPNSESTTSSFPNEHHNSDSTEENTHNSLILSDSNEDSFNSPGEEDEEDDELSLNSSTGSVVQPDSETSSLQNTEEKSSDYWPEKVKEVVHYVQDNYPNISNSGKAAVIREKLLQLNTSDCFYIIVYNPCGGYGIHSFNGARDQYLTSFRRGGCNVVIYRSLHWKNSTKKERDRIEKQVEKCRKGVIPLPFGERNYADFPRELINDRFADVEFCGMIEKRQNVVVTEAGSENIRDFGPGWWITAHAENLFISVSYILIAGFK